jgi:hypothetical protein
MTSLSHEWKVVIIVGGKNEKITSFNFVCNEYMIEEVYFEYGNFELKNGNFEKQSGELKTNSGTKIKHLSGL